MPAWVDKPLELMRIALSEAERGAGLTHPNPAVGAVIARGQRIIGVGHHRRPGLPHAEVEALRDAGGSVKGADLYVTLEPCCHWGRTAPCTDAIVASGIRRVFVAMRDPNPLMRGRGIRQLRKAGIEVNVGLEAEAARRLNEAYVKFMTGGMPFITLKLAQTLDGRIATRKGESRWITGAASRRYSRRLRSGAQAIMVGASTVVNDDPGLLPSPRREHYLRCVLDSGLRISPDSEVIRTAARHPTIVYHCRGSQKRARALESRGAEVVRLRAGRKGRVDIRRVVRDLAAREVMHLFVEGGGAVASSFLNLGLVDRLLLFLAPRVMGDVNGLGAFSEVNVKTIRKCRGFRICDVTRLDPDLMIELRPER